MQLLVNIENPIIHDSDDCMELERRVKEVDPYLHALHILSNKVSIVRIGRRSFRYPAHPSIDWVVSKVKYMEERDL